MLPYRHQRPAAYRNLEFPIDCPVCKLEAEEDDDDDVPEAAGQQLQTLTSLERTRSDNVSSQVNLDAVDPDHAMQLRASHSTPSLATAPLPHDSHAALHNMAGVTRHADENDSRAGEASSASRQNQESQPGSDFAFDEGGLKSWLTPSIDITARSSQHDSTHVTSMLQPNESALGGSSQHGVSSPSFPIIVSGTPITPSLISAEGIVHQDSRSMFSPHQLSQSSANLDLSRASLGSQAGGTGGNRGTTAQTGASLDPDDLSQRSVSLGTVTVSLCHMCTQTLPGWVASMGIAPSTNATHSFSV